MTSCIVSFALFTCHARAAHLIGYASVSMADGDHNAADLFVSLADDLAPIEHRVFPRFRLPIERLANGGTPQVPPLLKGYPDTRVEDGGRMVPPLLPLCAVAIWAERLKSHEGTVANERGAVQAE